MVIYTIAATEMVYLKVTYSNYIVTFPLDERLVRDYHVINKYGTFEFKHKVNPYLVANKN